MSKQTTSKTTRSDRSKRLLDLVMLLLRSRIPVTFREIRDQFVSYQTANIEAGLRAFERDKAELLELGVPIRYVTPEDDDSLEEGGYIVDLQRFRMPEVHLTADEVSALVLAASMARAIPGGAYPKIVDLALRKLAFDIPEPQDTPRDFLTGQISAPVLVHFPESTTISSKALSDRFAALEQATRNRKRITITYTTAADGAVRTRDVDPYGLIYRQASWLLVGYCHFRKDVRSFRVDRISEMKIAPKPKSPDFERPPKFDVRSYANRSPWTFRVADPEEVELVFLAEAADTATDDFGDDARIEKRSDGAISVHFTCSNPEFAISKILSAKGSIVIRKGEKLQQRLASELTELTMRYAQ